MTDSKRFIVGNPPKAYEVQLEPGGATFLLRLIAAKRNGVAASEVRVAVVDGNPEQAAEISAPATRSWASRDEIVGEAKPLLSYTKPCIINVLSATFSQLYKRYETPLEEFTIKA